MCFVFIENANFDVINFLFYLLLSQKLDIYGQHFDLKFDINTFKPSKTDQNIQGLQNFYFNDYLKLYFFVY